MQNPLKAAYIGIPALILAAGVYFLSGQETNKPNLTYKHPLKQDMCQGFNGEINTTLTHQYLQNKEIIPLRYDGNGIFNYATRYGIDQTIASSATHSANQEEVKPVFKLDSKTGAVTIDCGNPYAQDGIVSLLKMQPK